MIKSSDKQAKQRIKQISTLWLKPFKHRASDNITENTLYWKKRIRQS